MYGEGKPEQEFSKWNKCMKEKVQEKFKDCIMIDKSYSTNVLRLNLSQKP